MARLVGVAAASHAPLIARDWEKLPVQRREEIGAAFAELGARVAAMRADVLVMLAPDHWVNFFLDNLPSVCIGVGEEHDGPPEPFMKDFPRTIAGQPGLGAHIAATALAQDFEPSISHRLTLDHGFCLPLSRMGLKVMPAIVPIVVNDLEPPMPSVRRCLQWGKLLARAIESYAEPLRVAIVASGGLSHSIGESDMGRIDQDFDRACLDLFAAGAEEPLAKFLDRNMAAAGNGTHEVRNWVIAHAAAGSQGFDLVDYRAIPEVYVGCGFATWKV